jgi:GNAT superfamily N-acetyltransferase
MIRPMVSADLDAAKALLLEVGLASAVANVARYLRWQPDGLWVEDEGGIVGMVGLLHQGHVGFVGCMAVSPLRQGTGLGRRLLEHAHEEGRRAGLTTFLLEATSAGAKLYRAVGYVAEYETMIASRVPSAPMPASRITIADDAVVRLDREATGVDRAHMVRSLLDEPGAKLALPDGYGLLLGDRLGPVIARTPKTGHALFDALAPASATVTLPVPNAEAMAAATSHGFVEVRRLTRMRLGEAVAVRPDHVWSLASAGAG